MKRWRTLESQILFQSGFAEFRKETCAVGDGRIMPSYYILDIRDWVNVVAITKTKQILVVRQYRHAAVEVTLEIPGGAIDFKQEQPEVAARRELLEETGYQAGECLLAVKHRPNPALQSNFLWTYVFHDCEKVSDPDWDEFEEMEINEVSGLRLKEMVYSGEISHSLILASLFLAWPTIEKWTNLTTF